MCQKLYLPEKKELIIDFKAGLLQSVNQDFAEKVIWNFACMLRGNRLHNFKFTRVLLYCTT